MFIFKNVVKLNKSKKAFRLLLSVHLVLWTGYPIVWMLAASGFNLIAQGVETMFYTLLDLISKVGFGFLSLNTLSSLERAGETDKTVQNVEPSLR